MRSTDHIVSDPSVLLGKPCIAGTRISVEHILRELAAGSTIDEIVRNYPQVSADDVRAALEFAVSAVEMERVYADRGHAA